MTLEWRDKSHVPRGIDLSCDLRPHDGVESALRRVSRRTGLQLCERGHPVDARRQWSKHVTFSPLNRPEVAWQNADDRDDGRPVRTVGGVHGDRRPDNAGIGAEAALP